MSQDVNITIEDGALGVLPLTSDDLHCVIGCSSAGTPKQILSTRKIADLISTYGYGPMVEAAAFAIQQSGAPVLAIKTPSTTPGASSAVTRVGAVGTSVMSVSVGAAYDGYHAKVKVTKAGTIGVSGCEIAVSLDGGETFGPSIGLGTATTYAIPNTGLTVSFAAGTLVLDEQYHFTTTEPIWAIADVQAAIDVLKASTHEPRFVHLVGKVTAANALSVDAKLTECATQYRYLRAVCHARDYETADATEAAWIAALQSDFSSFSSLRTTVAAGHYMVTSPISARRYRRPLSFPAVARLCAVPLHVDAGRVKDGSLPATGTSATDGKVYHDERNNPGLDASRFMTARTLIGRPGLFIMNPKLMSPPGSDFTDLQYGFVIDKTCKLTREVMLNYLSAEVRLDRATGFILEKDAAAIEARLLSTLRDGLIATGHASAVSVEVSRVDNISSTKTISVTVRVLPLGYAKTININVAFTNPALVTA